MCGICGKITLDNSSIVNEDLIRRMCGVLAHRGPDDEGCVVLDSAKYSSSNVEKNIWPRSNSILKVGLGHRRLSIIDLSHAGHQPMSNEDETIRIVMNGEIYNFQELREDLKQKGHRFRSHTDTEVLIHLYEEKGIDCLEELRGPFSFAIWDSVKERLFIARDRIGKKPLYYTFKNQTLIFASEIKAILQDQEVSVEVNRPAITDYLSYGYTPTPETMFKGIKKLQPAHFMLYEGGSIKIEKYWELDFSKKIKLSKEEYRAKIMDLLEESTRIRLVSDVPLGALLSGGIDSSAVVYMMTRLGAKPVKTFSIGFEEKKYNELNYARLIAKRFDTEHREYIVKPDAIELLPKLVWHYNEPYADSSALPSYYVAKMTRQEVKVALNGDGGDEAFGGYERFMAARLAESLKMMPDFIKKAVTKSIPDSLGQKNLATKFKRFLSMTSKDYRERHYNWVSIFKDREKEDLFTDGFKKENTGNSFWYLEKAFAGSRAQDIVDKVMDADIHTNLLDDLLIKMDIATMANSLEGRSPFLDHKLMEFSASMPSNMKIRGFNLKYILKKSLSGALPKEVLSRGKMGFAVPLDRWFRGDLRKYSHELLLSQKALRRGYFKREQVECLLGNHLRGKANNGSRIWSLLNLELWHQVFIDK